MATAHDAAAYILDELGTVTAMKLQKLCYYSQAFSLAWFDEPIFSNRIEAWTNGPVIPDLWRSHKRMFTVEKITGGDPSRLSSRDKKVIDAVVEALGGLSGKQLSDLTHSEKPWQEKYDGNDAYPNGEITHGELTSFYKQKVS